MHQMPKGSCDTKKRQEQGAEYLKNKDKEKEKIIQRIMTWRKLHDKKNDAMKASIFHY